MDSDPKLESDTTTTAISGTTPEDPTGVQDQWTSKQIQETLQNQLDIQPSSTTVESPQQTTTKPKKKPKKKKVPSLRIFYGTFIHSTKESPLLILNKWLLGVDKGKIVFSEPAEMYNDIVEQYKLDEVKKEVTISLANGTFMIPGFVNAHCDAVSFLTAGLQGDKKLREQGLLIHDDRIANKLFSQVITKSLHYGTTTAAYNGTHIESVARLLSNSFGEQKQRAFVGFDVSLPEKQEDMYFIQLTKAVDVMGHIMRKQGRVIPHLIMSSPVPDWVEERVATLKQKCNVDIKVAIARTDSKGECVNGILDQHIKHGLLTEKTLVLHSPHCGHEKLAEIRDAKTRIIYRPSVDIRTNEFSDFQLLLGRDLQVALGSDLADSGSLSMLDVIRGCVHVSRQTPVIPQREDTAHTTEPQDPENPSDTQSTPVPVTKLDRTPDYRDFFRLATLGGAQVLGVDDCLGNFEVGKEFDAVLVDPHVPNSPFFVLSDKDSPEDILEKFLFCGDDRNITAVYISGQRAK